MVPILFCQHLPLLNYCNVSPVTGDDGSYNTTCVVPSLPRFPSPVTHQTTIAFVADFNSRVHHPPAIGTTTSYNGASSSNAFPPTRLPCYFRRSTPASGTRSTREHIYRMIGISMDFKMKSRPDSLSIATLPNTCECALGRMVLWGIRAGCETVY